MKIKFTIEEMNAIEEAYYDRTGHVPYDMEYKTTNTIDEFLRQLWIKMIDKYQNKINRN